MSKPESRSELTSTPVLGRPPLDGAEEGFAAGADEELGAWLLELPPPVLPAAAATTTVPCMNGWIVQVYEKVPAFENVWDPLWPLSSVPVSKPPSFAVAVCWLGPEFDQVTVSPTCTVIELGPKLKSLMVTEGSPAALTFDALCAFDLCLARGRLCEGCPSLPPEAA
jgi:hypothetical protein